MNMNKLKMSAIAVGVAVASPLSYADIELGKGLTVSGFVDMSFVHQETDDNGSTKVFAVDQVETSFMYAGSSGVSAQVDIEYGESGDDNGSDETFIEQAFITKQVTDDFSIKAGRFLSYSGWETEEPTGLFQYSGTGYAPIFYGFYQQGVSAYYDAGMVDLAISVVNDVFANPVENDTTQLGTEMMVAITPIENLTAKLFYMTEGEKDAVNAWVSYGINGFTLAAEYNTAEDTAFAGSDASGYLLMGNYTVGKFGITARYHQYDVEDAAGATVTDMTGLSIAPSYSIGDNLLLVAEFRMDTDDVSDEDTDTIALEALFTF